MSNDWSMIWRPVKSSASNGGPPQADLASWRLGVLGVSSSEPAHRDGQSEPLPAITHPAHQLEPEPFRRILKTMRQSAILQLATFRHERQMQDCGSG